MSLDVLNPELASLLARLRPYARTLVERAGEHALRLHAEFVSPEHLLSVLMDDSDSAAHLAAVHAFADPATISGEALALSPGLMVVASGSTHAFSTLAAEALASARAQARARGAPRAEVEVADVLAQAERRLEVGLRGSLRDAGLSLQEPPGSEDSASDREPAFFKAFSAPAKRVLSAANKLAASEQAPSIGPAHLFLAGLAEDPALATAVGISFHRARTLLAGKTTDPSPPRSRKLPPDPALLRYLEGIEDRADSLGLLAGFLSDEATELAGILLRSKLSKAFLDRGRGAFLDPEAVQEPAPPRR